MIDQAALLLIDVQRVYMEPDPMVTSDGNDLIPKCKGLIEAGREAGVPVIHVQHISEDQPDDPELIAVHPQLGRANGEPIIQKRFGSAFFKTELEVTLEREKARTLYVCGLATFGCVNATVMCAVCKDYDVRVVLDAHGSTGSPDTTAARMIEIFNETWERAGATLVRAKDVDFTA